jgi:hypothetical protein
MRTNIVIDDKLMNEALRASGLKTKKEAVELGLRTLIKLNKQEEVKPMPDGRAPYRRNLHVYRQWFLRL